MPPDEPDFRLDGYEAVNDNVDERFWHHIEASSTDFAVLAAHHTPDDQHSYYVLHDQSATWGIPGEPQLVALHLTRDTTARTFAFDSARLPLAAMAQSWLIARGCPKEAIALRSDRGTPAADKATMALEDRLLSDGEHFSLVASYTSDDDPDRVQITVLLAAIDESVPVRFRVLLENVDTRAWTHTLREGGFTTHQEAVSWLEAHWSGEGVPLPAVPPTTGRTTPSAMPGLPAPPSPRPPGPTR
ncbi:hypothetical protein [Streptomyces sp. MNP-20]|uniref:hypothetical protein n=1 Tax=Streptomyces sp. MNP-20 TaxID=2721165 RepID=UPI0020A6C138|nr:hypothetical protein [Streptomyces sp. MNP-20]